MLHRGVKPWSAPRRRTDWRAGSYGGDMDELSPDELERPPSPNRRRLRGVITLLVVAALVVAFGLEGSGFILRSSPAPEVRAKPVGNTLRLAVVNATGALSSMDAAGGSIVTYPAPGLTFVFPAWSPDGT